MHHRPLKLHPSIIYTAHGSPATDDSWHWTLSPVHHRANVWRQTPIGMSLDCGRKPEYSEKTHTVTGRTRKLHRERNRNLPVVRWPLWHYSVKSLHSDSCTIMYFLHQKFQVYAGYLTESKPAKKGDWLLSQRSLPFCLSLPESLHH